MNIKEVSLNIINMTLKAPFSTALGTVVEREGIIIKVMDKDGTIGFGETVAFSTPWYTEETVHTAFHMLKDILIPLILNQPVRHPSEVSVIFAAIRGNQMAKAGLETAIWDLYAKQQEKPLWQLIGGDREQIPAGVVIGTQDPAEAVESISKYLQEGYTRVKVKIKPGHDYELLHKIRRHYPTIDLMADANSAYTLKDVQTIKALDEFNLLMIEQPLGVDDIVEHAFLQKEIQTPICLDESIVSIHDAKSAIHLKSCGVINIKIGRVGGLWNAIKMHDLCIKNNIKVWCGGMIEFGISKAHNIALATKKGFSIPGDISSSSRYWEQDIIEPEISVNNGGITASLGYGIGYELNKKRLNEVTLFKEIYR
ncbi:o-succinylbenzoate synthase [Bacillus sp. FJAT-49736]|uniref:o-succinylbenzoate synthase n=1 Tax=Bacillus sp. FJAT-49736 TaxID=2833582 RepID=UPI001BC97351|nr:o-succinylbenzoate synthase [Bacillus sp. FJAT-49736]MBS4173900.1 o-succinylbenzoate synthase [Bacillus sp. FJAT-49736]